MNNKAVTKGNPGYITKDAKTAKIIYNQIFTLKMFLGGVEKSAEAMVADGELLLDLLQKEYHFI